MSGLRLDPNGVTNAVPLGAVGLLDGALIVGVRPFCRTSAPNRWPYIGCHPPGCDQEPGMSDHAVLRANRQALEMPSPDERLPGLRFGEGTVSARLLGNPGELGRRRDVTDQDSAGRQD